MYAHHQPSAVVESVVMSEVPAAPPSVIRALSPTAPNVPLPVPGIRILRMPDLEIKTGLKRSSLNNLQDPRSKYFDPKFAKKIYISSRNVGWNEHEVETWLSNRPRGGSEE